MSCDHTLIFSKVLTNTFNKEIIEAIMRQTKAEIAAFNSYTYSTFVQVNIGLGCFFFMFFYYIFTYESQRLEKKLREDLTTHLDSKFDEFTTRTVQQLNLIVQASQLPQKQPLNQPPTFLPPQTSSLFQSSSQYAPSTLHSGLSTIAPLLQTDPLVSCSHLLLPLTTLASQQLQTPQQQPAVSTGVSQFTFTLTSGLGGSVYTTPHCLPQSTSHSTTPGLSTGHQTDPRPSCSHSLLPPTTSVSQQQSTQPSIPQQPTTSTDGPPPPPGRCVIN